jgi:hypothetical protein
MLIWELSLDNFCPNLIYVHIRNAFSVETLREQIAADRLPLLRTILNLFRTAKATDPRDNIYGIVGLSSVRLDPQPAPTLSYEQSVEDIYRLWTVYILRTEKSLEILSMVNRYETIGRPLSCS